MFTLYVCTGYDQGRSTINLIDESGALAFSGPTVRDVLAWLWARDECTVVCMTDDGPELFLIEACGSPTLCLPSVSMRRAHLGRCDDPPRILGLESDPIRRARILDDRDIGPAARKRRRLDWLRRATAP